VREAGFERRLTTLPGLGGRFADRFRIPRFTVEDWTGEQFDERVREWAAA